MYSEGLHMTPFKSQILKQYTIEFFYYFFLTAMQNQPVHPCQSTGPMANGPVITLVMKIKSTSGFSKTSNQTKFLSFQFIK